MNIIQDITQKGKFILPYIQKYKRLTALVVGSVWIREAIILAVPFIFTLITRVFEDAIAENIAYSEVVNDVMILLAVLGALYIADVLSNFSIMHGTNRIQTSIMRDAANDFVEYVMNLSFRFHSNRESGRLSKEFARGIGGIESFLDSFIFNLIGMVFRLAVVFSIFAWFNPAMAGILAIMTVAFCSFHITFSAKMQERRKHANELDDEGAGKAMDALMNVETVKYFQQEVEEVELFQNIRQDWKQRKQYEWDGWSWIVAGQIAIISISVLGIVSLLVWKMTQGEAQLSDFVLITSYIGMIINVLWEFTHHSQRLRESFTDIESFFEYFQQRNEVVDVEHAKDLLVTQGAIVFENVSFGYSSNSKVLKNFDLEIAPGTSVAFVGPSGVGKSTLMKLLYRFYDPQEGRVLVDGQDISKVSQRSLRESLGIVPQSSALFNDTVAYNIAYGSENASQQDIERVAKLAHAHEFISKLKDGYETEVGERGVKLSGGEKQRIAIARAFLRNSPILVLDEATSALDSESEYLIQKALGDLMKDRTTLIIAHRLSTIMHADRIVVLGPNGVEESGTHEELIELDGAYTHLWNLQAGGYV